MVKTKEKVVESIIKKEKKIINQEKIEASNLQEEVKLILEKCINCGMCKSLCPVFKTLNEEIYSPRGRTSLMRKDIFDEILFKCNICKACENTCPLGIKVWEAVLKARESLVLEGRELKSNKEMIKNIREIGNPFGKNPEKSGKLYCC